MFNEGMMQMQPMFYPFYQQPVLNQDNIFFSGRNSSFSCYNPQKPSNEGLPSWSSMGQLDL
jgi:hypothetical protein